MRFYAILCHTVPYYITLYHTIPYNTIEYRTIPCDTIRYNTIPCDTIRYCTYTMPCHTIPLERTTPYCTRLYYTMPRYTVLERATPYYTILYYTIQYNTICTLLCCTVSTTLSYTILCVLRRRLGPLLASSRPVQMRPGNGGMLVGEEGVDPLHLGDSVRCRIRDRQHVQLKIPHNCVWGSLGLPRTLLHFGTLPSKSQETREGNKATKPHLLRKLRF